jgi:hypothetical protein
VSYTEAAMMREYVTSKSEFLHLDTFLNVTADLKDDYFLEVGGNSVWHATLQAGKQPAATASVATTSTATDTAATTDAAVGDAIIEAALWPKSAESTVYLVVRTSGTGGDDGTDGGHSRPYSVVRGGASDQRCYKAECQTNKDGGSAGLFEEPSKEPLDCTAGAGDANTDRAGMTFTNFKPASQDVTKAVEECKRACCADSTCDTWVMRNVTEANQPILRECAHGLLCCWKKTGTGLSKVTKADCISGEVTRPTPAPTPPPPLSTNLNGYAVGVQMTGTQSAVLTVERWTASTATQLSAAPGQHRKVLGRFNASAPQMECGVLARSWNILRVVVEGGKVSVWLNTMWTDTQGPGTAKGGAPVTAAPRLIAVDPNPLPPGGIAVVTQGDGSNVDYLGVLPTAVL